MHLFTNAHTNLKPSFSLKPVHFSTLAQVSSIFIGLSPELEMALYTVCVLLKPNDACTVSLGGKKIDIRCPF
jgi:hypothetical protein